MDFTVIDKPPPRRCVGYLQKSALKDAALVWLPRADARHVQEGFQAYVRSPSAPQFLLICSPLVLDRPSRCDAAWDG